MIFYISIFSSFILDYISKYLANNLLQNNSIDINNFISLKLVHNKGIAFSLAVEGLLLKILTVFLIATIFWYYSKFEKTKNDLMINLSFGLILGGALGNAWERILLSQVTDFISIRYFSVFNLADAFLTLGIIIFIIRNK